MNTNSIRSGESLYTPLTLNERFKLVGSHQLGACRPVEMNTRDMAEYLSLGNNSMNR